ncbi:protein FAR1-RELATED SEQUENCE 5-like [Vicia villosa]|uniref:protein FAR1-RELATED SEQUENCE 5-like n=1 Tax=Vicia villosa TaxID=3911 RepID=UPI00273CEF62|nr:protein FAR1-RELATED SEQUENCE 5-like [Vicia villosa]
MDFKVFGDVLAFDATYGTNKYRYPLVMFYGVNNHNHNIIFGGAIVANEKEETYVWVLEQILEAMSGKSPISVITDGDLAMKKAIKNVFLNAYHRLCAWHLIRNAMPNIGVPEFVSQFRKCMLGDYDLGEFRRKWADMIDAFGLHDNKWVTELYAKRKTWATAHVRGKNFAGFRTTSRCEGLHSEMGKFLHSRYNLSDFLLHFHRCLNYMRYKEVEADFLSNYGDPVLQTRFRSMECYAGKLFTREIFFMFCDLLARSAEMVVETCHQTYTCIIYTVRKYQTSKREWNISFYLDDDMFKCSCKKMESFGLPCEHIIALLIFLDVVELPKTLVADRWTKNVKEEICRTNKHLPKY